MSEKTDKRWEEHLQAYAAADALYKAKRYAAALAGFRRALSLAPDDVDTLWAIADCYSEQRRPRLAERYYRFAIKHASVKQRPELYFNLGNALFDQKRFKEAVTIYRQAPATMARKNLSSAKERLLTSRSRPTR